jgi:hypothetical protein
MLVAALHAVELIGLLAEALGVDFRVREARLGFGHIVVSEVEQPNKSSESGTKWMNGTPIESKKRATTLRRSDPSARLGVLVALRLGVLDGLLAGPAWTGAAHAQDYIHQLTPL